MLKKLSNYAFYIALTVELLLVILDKSVYIIRHDGLIFRFTFVLFLIKVLLTQYNRKEWAAIGAFALLGAISYLVTGRNEILRLVVMIAAFKDVKYDFVIKYVFYFTLAGCVLLIIRSFFGIGTFSLTRDFGRGEISTRYSLGLGHPNALHCMFWALSTLYLYIYRNRNKWIGVAVIFAANIGLFCLTDSRTGLLATLFTIGLFVIMNIKLSRTVERIIVRLTYVGIILSFVSSALMMSHKFFWTNLRRIDELLTGRILWTHMDIMEAKTFFWRPFGAMGQGKPTDLGLVKMFYWYGYIPVIAFIVISCILVRTAVREGDRIALVVVASIVFYSIFEGHAISVFLLRNYIFVLIGKYWTRMIGVECTESNVTDG